jgi:hypothetical protein
LIPAIPKRKSALENLSFQRLFDAAFSLNSWYGIELFDDIAEPDKDFLKLMLNRRHILVHNSGIVDEDYLRLSGDKHARLNQRVHIRSNEIKRLLPLVRRLCENFCSDMEKFDLSGVTPT